MMSPAAKAAITLPLVFLAAYGSYSIWRVYQAVGAAEAAQSQPVELSAAPPRPLADFSFTERSGQRVSLKSLEGDVWIASFFFAQCPGFCRQMNQAVAALHQELADSGVKFVSITVDPANDTPEQLRTYADSFGADPERWLFLTGELADTRQLGQDVFKVTVQGKEHSDRLVLVGPDGKVHGTYRALESGQVQSLKRKVRQLLDEREAT